MKVGDLVIRKNDRWLLLNPPVGLVYEIGTGYDGEQVKVLWPDPMWFNPKDGTSAEYAETLEVINESR